MNRVKCFVIEDLHRSRYDLRRYSTATTCPGPFKYHNAHSATIEERDDIGEYHCSNRPDVDREDPRWPTKCDHCSYQFLPEDNWQVWGDGLYKHSETGEIYTLRNAPAGAMWDATWWNNPAADGITLTVKLPEGTNWMVDGRASNCNCDGTNKNHRCWTRSGVVPNVTANPSISVPGYHGWLRSGWLEEC